MSSSDTALVLFPGALGDFICLLPVLCALRRRHHDTILLVAQPALLDLIRMPETATASFDRREVADLFAVGSPIAPGTIALFGGFATAYSWTGFGNANVSRRLAEATGGTVHVFAFRGMREREHATDYYARCFGCAPSESIASLLVEDAHWMTAFAARHRLDGRRVLLMHPGSGAPSKNWQGFAALASYWHEHDLGSVVVLRGPAEAERAMEDIGDAIPLDSLSLPQVVALLRRSSLYAGNDSGISHLAGAVGTPGVVVFGPTDPYVWAPRSQRLQVLHVPEPCPHCPSDAICLHRLPVETVVGVLTTLSEQT